MQVSVFICAVLSYKRISLQDERIPGDVVAYCTVCNVQEEIINVCAVQSCCADLSQCVEVHEVECKILHVGIGGSTGIQSGFHTDSLLGNVEGQVENISGVYAAVKVQVAAFAYHDVLCHVLVGSLPLQQFAVIVQGHVGRGEEAILCLFVVEFLRCCTVAVHQTGDVHIRFCGAVGIGHVCKDLACKVCRTNDVGVAVRVELYVILLGIGNSNAVHAYCNGGAQALKPL